MASIRSESVVAVADPKGETSSSVAYFRDLNDRPRLELYCQQHGLSNLPLSVCDADICRGDLLFEIEVDAVAS